MEHPRREDLTDEEWVTYWRAQPVGERLRAAWLMTCEHYGIDPDARMDKTKFKFLHRFGHHPIAALARDKDLAHLRANQDT